MDAGIAPGPPGNAMACNRKGKKKEEQEGVEEKDDVTVACCDAIAMRRHYAGTFCGVQSGGRKMPECGAWQSSQQSNSSRKAVDECTPLLT